jgi:hypothetical protein
MLEAEEAESSLMVNECEHGEHVTPKTRGEAQRTEQVVVDVYLVRLSNYV